ncbi:hypothetical protein Ae201684P_012044 [Aphanomyces euteiches]|uniref:Protein ENHANCED DISEASE RESISTANCE 2 C-terminal domain-containing protein n=1 Tax=Aphanomyces euteiches TaxID=100861 RepID=A0A6G0WJE7_9STRA|nr:hypothetical protein Ae201684_014610 [Aphanomyces euteiches]KAH9081071.1 hypothetical protein Ae201684P_012044 [Aphanomyces euteiches]KAH9139582.1 hypothetical protein AeRB84_016145 [Aphanomyces euteiches]
MTAFIERLIQTSIVFLEGLLLPLEVLLLLLFKSKPLACTVEQTAVHHYNNVPVQPQPIVHAKSDSCLAPSRPLRRTMTWEEKYAQVFQSKTRKMWSEPRGDEILVRGPKYMTDRTKIPAGKSVGTLVHVDVWNETKTRRGRQDHIAQADSTRAKSLVQFFAENKPDDILLVLNFQVPGTPFVHVVCYWLLPGGELTSLNVWTQFIAAIDSQDVTWCNNRFKLIPVIVDGPWLVKATVPQKPALIGNKLTQRYFRGANYVEIDMDINSSTIAANIVGLCRGYSKQLVVDLHLTLQGEKNDDELPERILGSVQLSHLDFACSQAIMD